MHIAEQKDRRGSIGHLTTYGPIDSPTSAPPIWAPRSLRSSAKEEEEDESRTRTNHIAIAVPPGVILTLISDIIDQEPGVITKRDDTRSLLPRPVDHVAFAKENPSYQGPGNSKNRLLPRLRSVRVYHANQPQYDLFTERQYPSSVSSTQYPITINHLIYKITTYTTIYASHYVRHRNPMSELGQWDYPN